MSADARGFDVEALLADALRPVEPPETLAGRVEGALSRITEIAAEELADWEVEAIHDPRTWVRPVAATAAGTVAAAGLVVLGVRRRRKPTGFGRIAAEVESIASGVRDRLRS